MKGLRRQDRELTQPHAVESSMMARAR
uniref:Uncharacterized protein n=1 Tax=Arundo donax TaxID=35708 RepID=A0A0A9GMW9_ARUDO